MGAPPLHPRIIQVILQYLRANGLQRTARVLVEESGVSGAGLEADALRRLREAIINRQWGEVMKLLEPVASVLQPMLLYDLYEVMLIDLIHSDARQAAETILQESFVMKHLQGEDAARWARLWRGETTKIPPPSSPVEVADKLVPQIPQLPAERLLTLLGQALRQEAIDDKIPPEGQLDLFYGLVAATSGPTGGRRDANGDNDGHGDRAHQYASTSMLSLERPIERCFCIRAFPMGGHPEVAAFSPSGRQLVLGLADGFLEMVNLVTGERRRDLVYQRGPTEEGGGSERVGDGDGDDGGRNKDAPSSPLPMVMEQPILSLDWSPDESLLAVGSLDGSIGIWSPETGARLALLPTAHRSGVGCLRWSADGGASLLSRAYDEDGLVKQWNWRSGRLIRQFPTQTSSYVTDMRVTGDTTLWVGTAEGQLLKYDLRTGALLERTAPLAREQLAPEAIVEIVPLTTTASDGDIVLVCGAQGRVRPIRSDPGTRSSVLEVNTNGAGVRSALCSPHRRHLYLLLDNGHILRMDLVGGSSEGASVATVLVGRGPELLGGAIHPHVNQLVTLDSEGTMKYWK